MGRAARGVKGITLAEGDFVVGVALVDDEKYLLTMTEGGVGKRTSFEDFRQMKHRGGRGVSCQNITEKTGKLATVITVSEDDDIMLITNEGTIIRTSVSSINVYSRTATGVIVMRLAEGSYINNVARLEKAEEIERESAEVDEEIARMPKPEPAAEDAMLESDNAADSSENTEEI